MLKVSTCRLLALTLLLLLAISGCSDSDSTGTGVTLDFLPGPGITGIVVDVEGDPIAGAAIGLVYDINPDTLLSRLNPLVIRPQDKPRTQIEFAIPEAGYVRVWITDYAGHTVRTLVDDILAAGRHSVMWLATDDAGNRVPTGMYTFHVWLNGRLQAESDMFLYDAEPVSFLAAPNAVTDESGRFQIPDNLIPTGESLIATDETGGYVGDITISTIIEVMAVHDTPSGAVWVATTIDYRTLPNDKVLKLVLPN